MPIERQIGEWCRRGSERGSKRHFAALANQCLSYLASQSSELELDVSSGLVSTSCLSLSTDEHLSPQLWDLQTLKLCANHRLETVLGHEGGGERDLCDGAQMGGRVGIFDADVYGPSLPTMTSPEVSVLIVDPQTRVSPQSPQPPPLLPTWLPLTTAVLCVGVRVCREASALERW